MLTRKRSNFSLILSFYPKRRFVRNRIVPLLCVDLFIYYLCSCWSMHQQCKLFSAAHCSSNSYRDNLIRNSECESFCMDNSSPSSTVQHEMKLILEKSFPIANNNYRRSRWSVRSTKRTKFVINTRKGNCCRAVIGFLGPNNPLSLFLLLTSRRVLGPA